MAQGRCKQFFAAGNLGATLRRLRLACLVGLFALLFLTAPLARAQDPAIKALASQLAASISAANQKSVIVFDFVGPGDKFTALGPKLADQFSAALAQSATTFTVADRKEILDALQKKHYELQALLGTDLAVNIAHDLRVESAIFGQISMEENRLIVTVELSKSKKGHLFKGLRVSMPLTDEMKRLSAEQTEAQDPLRSYPQSGENGYSHPICLYCPVPQFPTDPVARRRKGAVILMVVIGTDGRANTILVAKWLPDGLTEAVISAVQSWRFTPATGPDGKPAAVVTPLEVAFRVY